MRYLSACLTFKDAGAYLTEWLEFHKTVGIEHFYLYDNGSSDDLPSLIHELQSAGEATLIDWPAATRQATIIDDCLRRARSATRWLAFIDDDEFLFPTKALSLCEVLQNYEPFAGLAVCWLLFGSNGHTTRPNVPVTHAYTRRASWVDPHMTCVVDPTRVLSAACGAHAFDCVAGETIVDEKMLPMTGSLSTDPCCDVIRMNHYLIKSYDELRVRRSRMTVDAQLPLHTIEQWLEFDRHYNEVEDLSIARFTAMRYCASPLRHVL